MLAYLMLNIQHIYNPELGKTMNLVLSEKFVDELGFGGSWAGGAFILATIFSEGTLLLVAAQAGREKRPLRVPSPRTRRPAR